jgi:class 3 adenylate cyclase
MEPRIQYARTSDGVSIAFWTLGEGMPFVQTPLIFGHIQLEWQIPEIRRWYERLAEKRKLVRYDGRGTGLSERDVTGFSLDAHVLDLEAVVDCLGLERFALFGTATWGPLAIAYAARHAERVSHLVLWASFARASDWSRSPLVQAVRALMDKDWETYTETAAHTVLGWSAGEKARRYAALIRESITPETLRTVISAQDEVDVTALLPQVRSPTVVLQYRQSPVPNISVARDLASRIPEARLVLLEGEATGLYLGDTDAVLAVIGEFLGEGEEAAAVAEPPAAGAFRTLLFTDVEGSTALTERVGDAKAREVLRAHERIVREALKAHGGAEVKTMGDGFMASFSSATQALECAIAIQRAFAEHSEAAEEPIRVRIGLNAGGGEILASDVVRQLVAGKGFLFSDRGDVALRGFEDPLRLYEVRWREG